MLTWLCKQVYLSVSDYFPDYFIVLDFMFIMIVLVFIFVTVFMKVTSCLGPSVRKGGRQRGEG